MQTETVVDTLVQDTSQISTFSQPAFLADSAAASPAGPPPMMTMSSVRLLMECLLSDRLLCPLPCSALSGCGVFIFTDQNL